MARRKTEWLKLESRIRQELRDYRAGRILAVEAVRVIDELIARETGRDNELPEDPMSWEPTYVMRNTEEAVAILEASIV